jgi:predicted dehydrogenase
MAVKRLRAAVIGTGFMGRVHLEALRRVEFVDIAAVCGRDRDTARKLGEPFGIQAAVSDYRELLQDPTIDAVHICTPNATHYPIAKDALLAGKHVLCEKPLATSIDEAKELIAIAQEKKLRNCTCHNLRYYPMVQHMRRMQEEGDLGQVLVVQGTYSQDWLLYETDWNWRIDPKAGGSSRVMADIGSHWFDMAEHVTGLKVRSLCADLQTFYSTRKRPKTKAETFAGKLSTASETEDISVTTEDFGAVVFRMDGAARGAMTASQVSAGCKNRLSIEIYGTKASVAWNQERPDELWLGQRDQPNQVLIKDPSLLKNGARSYADLPGGHAEGYSDTFKHVFQRFYASIRTPESISEYPQMLDGLRQLNILQAELESNKNRGWIDLPD